MALMKKVIKRDKYLDAGTGAAFLLAETTNMAFFRWPPDEASEVGLHSCATHTAENTLIYGVHGLKTHCAIEKWSGRILARGGTVWAEETGS